MLLAACVCISLAGCGKDSGTLPAAPRVDGPALDAVVTGAARSNLVNGSFVLSAMSSGETPEITATQAEALAMAWRTDFGPWVQGFLDEGHGGPVPLAQLTVCGKTLYVRSHYEMPPATAMADPVVAAHVRGYGPWWLVSLCEPGGGTDVVLAVSAYATDLSVADGHIVVPRIGGNWFIPLGVRPDEALLPTPEDAAVRAAQATGRRISGVPELVMTAWGVPQLAQWRLTVEAPAAIQRGDGQSVAVREFYVGRPFIDRPVQLRVAGPRQPASALTRFYGAKLSGDRVVMDQAPTDMTFARRPELASELLVATPTPAQNPATGDAQP